MPSSPKFGNAFGDIGIVEVFKKFKAEDLTETDRHIAVTREVEVDAEHIGDGVDPEEKDGFIVAILIEGEAEFAHLVGNEDLFAKTDDETADTERDLFNAVRSADKLFRDITVTNDRSCNELREERNVGCKIDIIFLRGNVAAINVNVIAEDLKKIEADTDGKNDIERRNVHACQSGKVCNEEVCIFEVHEKRKLQGDSRYHKDLGKRFAAEFFDQKTEYIPNRNGCYHQDRIFRLTPSVEEKAGKKKPCVLQKDLRKQEVNDENDWQKII